MSQKLISKMVSGKVAYSEKAIGLSQSFIFACERSLSHLFLFYVIFAAMWYACSTAAVRSFMFFSDDGAVIRFKNAA